MIATCPNCRNTGLIGDHYCTCPAATALRARIAPLLADTRAQIDQLLARPSLLAGPMGSCDPPDELTLN